MADALAEAMGRKQASGLPAWVQDGNRRETGSQSREGLAGRLGHSRPAKARGISGEEPRSPWVPARLADRVVVARMEGTAYPFRSEGPVGYSGVVIGEDSSGMSVRAITREAPRGRVPVATRRAEANRGGQRE